MERIITITGTGSGGIGYRIRGRREASAYGLSLPYQKKSTCKHEKKRYFCINKLCSFQPVELCNFHPVLTLPLAKYLLNL